MIIRRCTPEDCQAVHYLICDLENEQFDYDTFQDIYLDLINKENNVYLVCADEEKIIGFMSLEMNEKLHHNGRVCIIEEFVIDPEYRSKGVGKWFLNEATTYAKEKGCQCIELTSNFRRIDAHRFYEANGITKTSYKFFKDLSH